MKIGPAVQALEEKEERKGKNRPSADFVAPTSVLTSKTFSFIYFALLLIRDCPQFNKTHLWSKLHFI